MDCSIIVPIYNDAILSDKFCEEFEKVFQEYFSTVDIQSFVELIYVNDGSKNDSMEVLRLIATKYQFMKVIDLSRNFGQHVALTAGYAHASGDYVGMLNVDMQEHPRELIKFLEYFKNNPKTDFVLGLRRYRKDGSLNKLTSKLFGKVMNKLTGDNTPLNSSTMRLMNRKFVTAYLSLNEKNRYLPGLENWLGFKHGYVEIEHHARLSGKSSYNFAKRIKMAVNAILSFSDLPLRFAVTVGFFVSLGGFLMILILLIQKFFLKDMQPGYTSTVSLIVFFAGFQIIVIGLASLYIGRILREVQNRPLFIINEKINF